jgi:hypothetical protein
MKDNTVNEANAIVYKFDNARLGKIYLTLMLLNLHCWFLAAYSVTIIGFMMPSLQKEWQVSTNGLGLLASIGMADALWEGIQPVVIQD